MSKKSRSGAADPTTKAMERRETKGKLAGHTDEFAFPADRMRGKRMAKRGIGRSLAGAVLVAGVVMGALFLGLALFFKWEDGLDAERNEAHEEIEARLAVERAEDMEAARFYHDDPEKGVPDYVVLTDRETGVQYLAVRLFESGSYSVTPLLGPDGKPLVSADEDGGEGSQEG